MSTSNTPPTDKSNILLSPPPGSVNEPLAYYLDWCANAAAVWDTYAAWTTAPKCDRPTRFSAYMSALEREESAATTYAVVVENVERAIRP